MQRPIAELASLLRELDPVLNDGVYIFAQAPAGFAPDNCIGMFREAEGVSVIVTEREAGMVGLTPQFRAAWITLRVHSDLHAIGLTACFSTALAAHGVSCNVVSGVHHDHLFVPLEKAQQAMSCLETITHFSCC